MQYMIIYKQSANTGAAYEKSNKNNTDNATTVVQNGTVMQNDLNFIPDDDLPF